MLETPCKILTVDDESSVSDLLARYLNKEGYECHTANSGEEALEILKSNDFSLMLSDINMPGMTGLELQYTAKRRYPDLAVIMVTAMDDRDIARSALETGIYSYIIKPFEKTEVLINVANALRLRELEISNKNHIEELDSLVAERTKELENALVDLKSSQEQILQQEKMACIGQLSAGVAHEINNPVGFISSNLHTMTKYMDRITKFIEAQAEIVDSFADDPAKEDIKKIRKKLKLDYVIEDITELLDESRDGTDRIKKIVQGLKNFSRKDQNDHESVKVNDILENTLNIIWNELKYKATVEKDYGDVPNIECYPQQLGQVFMNLLVNAGHAIEDQGVISIKTWDEGGQVHVSITDTGSGITQENLEKIFEAFFTTKEVGKGTGLGLSIVNEIIEKHGGNIQVDSEIGKGTTFTVNIPLENKAADSENITPAAKEEEAFKTCPMCASNWENRDTFLDDHSLNINGYDANFDNFEESLFYFTHKKEGCFSTMVVEACKFLDLYSGEKYTDRRTGKEECPGYCLDKNQLDRCDAHCECAFTREVIQIIKERQGV